MSDPLSIAASVTGLLTVAGQIYTIISGFIDRVVDAPESAVSALAAVDEMRSVLRSVKQVMDQIPRMPKHRKDMIHLQHLVVTFREAIKSVSELEAIFLPISGSLGTNNFPIIDRYWWALQESKIVKTVQGLERHKTSFSLMLNILQCESDIQAKEDMSVLQQTMQIILQRLERLEDDRSTIRPHPLAPDIGEAEAFEAGSLSRRSFEVTLETTRVYRRVQTNECDVSFTSESMRGWSMLSDLSLSDVSLVSVIALPITWEEIDSIAPNSTFARILYPSRGSLADIPETLEVSETRQRKKYPVQPHSEAMRLKALRLKTEKEKKLQRRYMARWDGDESEDSEEDSKREHQGPIETPHGEHVPVEIQRQVAGFISEMQEARDRNSLEQGSFMGYAESSASNGEITTSEAEAEEQPSKPPAKAMNVDRLKHYNVVLLGERDSGKSSLGIQFCLNHFVESYDPTIEDSYKKLVTINGEECVIQVFDTAGQEEYTALRDLWIREGHAFLIVYSVTNRPSFDRVRKFYMQIARVMETEGRSGSVMLPLNRPSPLSRGLSNLHKLPIVLVGNNLERVNEREVSTQEGFAMARDLGCEFLEASAKNCVNVDRAFYDAVRMHLRSEAKVRHEEVKGEEASQERSLTLGGDTSWVDIPRQRPGFIRRFIRETL